MALTIYSLWLRGRILWLRYEVDECERRLFSISAQRANDFEAERILHRDLCEARAELHELTRDAGKANLDLTASSSEKFRPHLINSQKIETDVD